MVGKLLRNIFLKHADVVNDPVTGGKVLVEYTTVGTVSEIPDVEKPVNPETKDK